MGLEEYKALCTITNDSKASCKALGCKFKKARKKKGQEAKCTALSVKKTRCARIEDEHLCLRLGCNADGELVAISSGFISYDGEVVAETRYDMRCTGSPLN